MKKTVLILLLFLLAFAAMACGKEEKQEEPSPTPTVEQEPSATPSPTNTPEATPTPELSEEEIWYNDMIADSLMSTGNNARVKDVIRRAQAGEDVYIATIGGSITEGEGANMYLNCYAYQTYQYFVKDIAGGGSNVHFVNAGVSGTPSTFGVIRYEDDVVAKLDGHLPDLVIVEFAVNDYDDPTNGKAYEGLVRHILKAENNPAVVLLFSVFQSQWNLQDRLGPIGKYYDLPMVSIKDAAVPRLKNGTLTDREFFKDIYHPTTYGHTIMLDCLKNLFNTIMEEEEETMNEVPERGYMSANYDDVKRIQSTTEGIDITVGSFTQTDTAIGSVRYDNTKICPNNWKRDTASGNESFVMKLNCKNLLLTYKSSGSAGKVDVYVDGEYVKTIDGTAGGGWNNPYTSIIIDENEAAEHTIEIKMAEGNETKDFTIMTFGYSE